jgi:hypothetical protein
MRGIAVFKLTGQESPRSVEVARIYIDGTVAGEPGSEADDIRDLITRGAYF